tara:strand:+ start:6241 stop:7098 length:858 start_codon:yes stop_codon:yes gene_type:complete
MNFTKHFLSSFLVVITASGASCTASLDGPVGNGDRQDEGPSTSSMPGCDDEPTLPPNSLGLDPFYEKYVDAGGIPIVASAAVSDDAFLVACEIVSHMVSQRPDVVAALVANDVRVGIISVNDGTTDMPEHRDLDTDFPLPNGETWDDRTRGVGATHAAPLASVGEENLLGLVADRYFGQSILVHEFGHTVFDLGIATADPDTSDELDEAFRLAQASGLYGASYAGTNSQEYWAEGVQSWYDTNPNVDGNPVETRDDLMQMDADLAILLAEVLPDDGFVVRTASER